MITFCMNNSFSQVLERNRSFWLFALAFFVIQPFIAQDYELILRPEALKANYVKSVSIRLKSGTELTDEDSLEVGHIELDSEGRIVNEKYYRLFDVILYSQEYTYVYNTEGQLIEKIETQLEYPKNQTDSSLLDITGFGPSTRKWTYRYTAKGKLKEEIEFLSATDLEPIIRTVYRYDLKGKLTKKRLTNLPNPKQAIYSNSILKYSYDSYNRLVEEKMHWTKKDVTSVKTYKFNEQGLKISESIIYDDFDRGIITKFEYDQDRLKRISYIDIENIDWFKELSFEHNPDSSKSWEYHEEFEKPNAKVHFEYDEKRLLRNESWYTDKTNLKYTFTINYLFY
jgi:hypothetical protein